MKKINSIEDLAISGAPPAFTEPLHVGRPNIGNRERFLQRVNKILDIRWLTNNGPLVQEFESEVADFLKAKHCIAMCNGTIALEIAIRALDLKGEVIVPSYTFIATAHALQWQEITPVFADIDTKTHNLDPDAVRRMITPRTTGIVGVHLWGRPAPMGELQAIAGEHGLKVLYDASHAFGCSFRGKPIGNFGECEVFSFHATKFISTFEGGAVVTNNEVLAEKMRLMRNFGFAGFDNVIYPGTNGKMTEIAAAFGLTNLEALDSFVEANRRNYEIYRRGIASIPGLSLLEYDPAEKNNYQYIVVEVGEEFPIKRDEIVGIFHAENVLVRRYFWPGCHNMMPYKAYYPHAGVLLPMTAKVADRVVLLPTGSAITENEIGVILDILSLLQRATGRKPGR
jgi:dTDP-4-amino-4,6-dideoxygalactose transaminase